MQLEHSFTVPVGIGDVWPLLLDIERVAPCMPGAALDSVDGDHFTGIVKVKLGPIGLTYKGKASYIEKDESAHRAVIDARGREARGSGTATAKVSATLTESGGSTKVDVVTDLDITGKPAQFGRGVMEEVGNKLIGQFADCLAGKLTGGATPAADAAPAPHPTDAPEETETPEATEAPETPEATEATEEPEPPGLRGREAAAAATVPETEAPPADQPPAAAAPAPKPGVTAAPARPDTVGEPRRGADEVEPINLIHTAGPAIAKRLLPLIAAVIVVLLVLRHRRR